MWKKSVNSIIFILPFTPFFNLEFTDFGFPDFGFAELGFADLVTNFAIDFLFLLIPGEWGSVGGGRGSAGESREGVGVTIEGTSAYGLER